MRIIQFIPIDQGLAYENYIEERSQKLFLIRIPTCNVVKRNFSVFVDESSYLNNFPNLLRLCRVESKTDDLTSS